MRGEPENLLIGMVERAVLKYLYEDDEEEAGHTRYEIILIDRFESPHEEIGALFTVAVKEQFTLPQQPKETLTRLAVLLVTFNSFTQHLTTIHHLFTQAKPQNVNVMLDVRICQHRRHSIRTQANK